MCHKQPPQEHRDLVEERWNIHKKEVEKDRKTSGIMMTKMRRGQMRMMKRKSKKTKTRRKKTKTKMKMKMKMRDEKRKRKRRKTQMKMEIEEIINHHQFDRGE